MSQTKKKNSMKKNIYLKLIAIVFISLLLLIPTAMIKSIIHERESRQESAIYEISSKWAVSQLVIGPYITIPYYSYLTTYGKDNEKPVITKSIEYLHILPENLNIQGNLKPFTRYRGIYEVVVYNSDLSISGNFNFNREELEVAPKDLLFDKAKINFGINDLRGIENQVELKWSDEKILFEPGTSTDEVAASGINAQLDFENKKQYSYDFSFKLNLKGSQKIDFIPMGKTTKVNLTSSWDNPSFGGNFLPDNREIGENGFKAEWTVFNLNRNFPQILKGSNYFWEDTAFGVNLLLPVDSYQKSTRTVKYAILFIALTFMVFFFVEIMKKNNIHPVQYILVGLALVIFFSLLISISEHLNFNLAYLISSAATILLIFTYVKSFLKSFSLAALIGGLLFILYSFIFVIIQLQSYSLLIGSIGLFIILGLVMYFTRKIDWYNL